jgi:hypothetical protein
MYGPLTTAGHGHGHGQNHDEASQAQARNHKQPLAKNRLEVMLRLEATLPTNDFGMPTTIYRADAIPHMFDSLPAHQQQAVLSAAALPIGYADGFPTTPQGRLLWEQLEFEGAQEYMLFEKFLGMQNTHGYRSTQILARTIIEQKLAANLNQGSGAQPRPAATATAEIERHNQFQAALQECQQHLQEVATYHYWGRRAQAFDLVGMAAHRRIRSRRAVLLEDEHFNHLSKVATKVVARLDRITDDEMDAVSPMDAVKMLKEVVQLQRVSVGLPAAGPADAHLPGAGAPTSADQGIEVHLKTIAKQTTKGPASKDLLNNEEDAIMAQELVIRHLSRQRNGS